MKRIDGWGDVERIKIDLAPFDDLAAGQSRQSRATLDTSSIGSFNATYTLWLGEAAAGAYLDSTMTIRIIANVLAPTDTDLLAAPDVEAGESDTLALLLVAVAGCLAWSRLEQRRLRA